ncbi:hypothetical protein PGTUg99_010111 [Puccinia graminis f. sp. tritici]|uniref:Uncharacterized protein n=1 Tax=Puccinia graminis f. sp. tritici TaxID=56615 RepID=A0A5B0LGX0_PUCGR|nr:hypothetical protein PGTUg99_010111 [Puccinia graminis f. sp. tritici]
MSSGPLLASPSVYQHSVYADNSISISNLTKRHRTIRLRNDPPTHHLHTVDNTTFPGIVNPSADSRLRHNRSHCFPLGIEQLSNSSGEFIKQLIALPPCEHRTNRPRNNTPTYHLPTLDNKTYGGLSTLSADSRLRHNQPLCFLISQSALLNKFAVD